jgi:hypothetical protein
MIRRHRGPKQTASGRPACRGVAMSFAHSKTHENHPLAPPYQGGVGEVADERCVFEGGLKAGTARSCRTFRRFHTPLPAFDPSSVDTTSLGRSPRTYRKQRPVHGVRQAGSRMAPGRPRGSAQIGPMHGAPVVCQSKARWRRGVFVESATGSAVMTPVANRPVPLSGASQRRSFLPHARSRTCRGGIGKRTL